MKIAIRLEKKKIPSMIRIASQIRLALAKLTLLRLLLPPSAHMISTIRLTNGIVTTKRIRNHSPTEMIWSCGDWTGMDEALENKNIFWNDDLEFVLSIAYKTVKRMKREFNEDTVFFLSLYNEKDIERLRFIMDCRANGMKLECIERFIEFEKYPTRGTQWLLEKIDGYLQQVELSRGQINKAEAYLKQLREKFPADVLARSGKDS